MNSGKVAKQLPWQPHTITLILKILPMEALNSGKHFSNDTTLSQQKKKKKRKS